MEGGSKLKDREKGRNEGGKERRKNGREEEGADA